MPQSYFKLIEDLRAGLGLDNNASLRCNACNVQLPFRRLQDRERALDELISTKNRIFQHGGNLADFEGLSNVARHCFCNECRDDVPRESLNLRYELHQRYARLRRDQDHKELAQIENRREWEEYQYMKLKDEDIEECPWYIMHKSRWPTRWEVNAYWDKHGHQVERLFSSEVIRLRGQSGRQRAQLDFEEAVNQLVAENATEDQEMAENQQEEEQVQEEHVEPQGEPGTTPATPQANAVELLECCFREAHKKPSEDLVCICCQEDLGGDEVYTYCKACGVRSHPVCASRWMKSQYIIMPREDDRPRASRGPMGVCPHCRDVWKICDLWSTGYEGDVEFLPAPPRPSPSLSSSDEDSDSSSSDSSSDSSESSSDEEMGEL